MTSHANRPEDTAGDTQPTAAQLAGQERLAARTVELGSWFYVLLACLLIYVVSLFLPQVTGVKGWQVLVLSRAAEAGGVKLTEYVLAWLCFLGVGVGTAITLATRRTVAALVSWMLTTVGVAFALLATWLRMQRPAAEEAITAEVGTMLMIGVVVVACAAYSMTALRRSPEQKRIARARAQVKDQDPVAQAQRESGAVLTSDAENPLLVDDRRARSQQRAQRRQAEREAAQRAVEDSEES
ncbi:Rv2732c family membrane protein [Corynebacterium atypicum]|uniref:Rv2732c family membrane protein n=1 Tax=Corynebacterium atypicum TaxID=191610 RepID=UPI0006925D7B|nr:hypothetical protein [Corynebacterium atypicum]